MKIALVAPFAKSPKGTTSARVLPIARALVSRGHQCIVLIPPYDNRDEWSAPTVDYGVHVEWLKPTSYRGFRWSAQAYDQFAMYLAAVRRLEAVDPDVIHVFKPKAISGFVLIDMWFRAMRAALVLDCDDWEGRHGWSKMEVYPWLFRWIFDVQERFSLGRNDGVTVASDELLHRVASYDTSVMKIPNFYDPIRYAGWHIAEHRKQGRACLGVSDDCVVGVIYSRFFEFPLNGYASLIRRFISLLPEARIIVIGQGARNQHVELKSLIVSAGLEAKVGFWGWDGLETACQGLAAADVALMPSVDTTATRSKCPVRLLDLVVAGLPVAAHNVGEAGTYIQDGVNGHLVTAPDIDGLACAARNLVQTRRGDRSRDSLNNTLLNGALSSSRAAEDLEMVYGKAILHRAGR